MCNPFAAATASQLLCSEREVGAASRVDPSGGLAIADRAVAGCDQAQTQTPTPRAAAQATERSPRRAHSTGGPPSSCMLWSGWLNEHLHATSSAAARQGRAKQQSARVEISSIRPA